MRKLLFVIAAAGLLVVVLAPIAAGDDNNRFKASLNGYYEVPSISTGARASFHARLNSAGTTLSYSLTIRNFSENPLFAHIHFARPDVNGGVIAFLCGGGGKPACPANGTVTGTINAANVIGPAGQGIAAGEFGELIRAMRNGATYANVHSPTYHGRGDPRQHPPRRLTTASHFRTGRRSPERRPVLHVFATCTHRCGLAPDVCPIDLDRMSPHGRHRCRPRTRGDHGHPNRRSNRRGTDRRERLPDAQRSAPAVPHRAHPGSQCRRGPRPGRLRAPDHRGPGRPRARRDRRLVASRGAQPCDEPWSTDLGRRPPALRARRVRLGALAGEPDHGERGASCRRRRPPGPRRDRSPRAHPRVTRLSRGRDRPLDRAHRPRDADPALSRARPRSALGCWRASPAS